MLTNSSAHKGITRRGFLATSAAVVGAGALGTSTVSALAAQQDASTTADEQTFVSLCRGNCIGGCCLDVTVRDGKVVKVLPHEMPNPKYTRCCLKGQTNIVRLYDEHRLKYPLKRATWSPDDPRPEERGKGEWERVTWDEALDAIANKWTELRERYGNEALAFHHVGATTTDLSYSSPCRLEAVLGACEYGGVADMAFMSHIVKTIGMGEMYTGSEPYDEENAKLILIWGSNCTESQMQDWRFVMNAVQNNGAKIYAVMPSFTMGVSKSDYWLRVKPTTDAILALAMCNIIIDEDIIDHEFVTQHTVAPFLIKEDGTYLRTADLGELAEGATSAIVVTDGENVGTPAEIPNPLIHGTFEFNGITVTTAYDKLKERIAKWTPEVAAEMCEVPIDGISQFAHAIAKDGPVCMEICFGPDRYTNGHYAYFAIATLMMLTGNLGKRGTALSYKYPLGMHYSNRMIYQNPGRIGTKMPVQMLEDTIVNHHFGDHELNIKALYITYANTVGSSVDRQATLRAFKELDIIVTQDMVMSDSAYQSDFVLPVPHWFEHADLHISGNNLPYCIYCEQAVPPQFDTKTDFQIVKEIGTRMGFGDYFNQTEDEVIDYLLDTATARALGITGETIREQKTIRCHLKDPYLHAEGGVFPTATGRGQFYLETISPTYSYGQEFDVEFEKFPDWKPAREVWGGTEYDPEYPLACVQEHTRWRTHSQFGRIAWLKELDPECTVRMNPRDAKERGIENHEIVEVYNKRGHLVCRCIYNEGLRPGQVNIPHGWQADQCIEGSYQDLTCNVINPYVPTGAFTDTAVNVRKWEGSK